MSRKKLKTKDIEVEVLPPLRPKSDLVEKRDKRFSAKLKISEQCIEVSFDIWLRGKSSK